MICVFKCQSCGDRVTYNIDTHRLVCPTCGQEKVIYEYDSNDVVYEGAVRLEDGIVNYACPSCGAKVITKSTSAKMRCTYCDEELAAFGIEENELSPELIIPCKLGKDQAMGMFIKWWFEHPTMPKFDVNKLQVTIQDIYVPVWLVDSDATTRMQAVVAPDEVEVTNDMNVATKFIDKEIWSQFFKIPTIGTKIFSVDRFNGIEPYIYTDLVKFNSAYLAGHQAERFSYTPHDVLPLSINKIKNYGYEQCKQYIEADKVGGPILQVVNKRCSCTYHNVYYALVPVWVVSYYYKGKRHTAYVNGQTGKTDGTILFANKKYEWDVVIYSLSSMWMWFSTSMMAISCVKLGKIYWYFTLAMIYAILICVYIINMYKPKSDATTKHIINEEVQYRQGMSMNVTATIIGKGLLGGVAATMAFFNIYLIERNGSWDVGYYSALSLVVALLASLFAGSYFAIKRKQYLARKEKVGYMDYLKAAGTYVLGTKYSMEDEL